MIARPALAAAAVVLATTVPAHADEDRLISLSRDGVHWHAALDRPLFEPGVLWVPGDVRTARFYVRNDAAGAGEVTVDVERVRREALLDTGFLGVTARADGGAWHPLASGNVAELLDAERLATGEPVAVEIRVAMDDSAPNGTMVLSTDLDITVTIADARAGDGPPDAGGTGSDLPQTGADVPPWLPPLALGLLGAGVVLVARRRSADDDGPTLRSS